VAASNITCKPSIIQSLRQQERVSHVMVAHVESVAVVLPVPYTPWYSGRSSAVYQSARKYPTGVLFGRNHQHRHLLGFYIAIIHGYGISKNFDLLSIFVI
jgi:hypothetical protein